MPQVQDVARQVLAALDTTAGHLLACDWVSERYIQLCSRARFRHLRRIGQLAIPGPVQAGRIAVTQGSRVVVGDPDAVVAWEATPDLVGRHLRYMTHWYEVEGREGPSSLRLLSPVTEGTNAAASYMAVRRYVPLARDARWLSMDGWVLQRVWLPLRPQPLVTLDYMAPSRPLVGPWPLTWSEVTSLADGTRRVEFYPFSAQDESVSYIYWADPVKLPMDAEVPGHIDAGPLVDGALIDAMRYNAGRAANAGKLEEAAYWRNEYRAQSLIWERRILEAIRTDRGLDDVTMILQLSNAYYGIPQDLMTARDHVWYGWRP